MQEQTSWEVVVSSLISQLQNIEATLKNQNLSVSEYLQQNGDKAKLDLLHAQLRSTETSFERLEDKLHDMIIYLCRAMTISKAHKLDNLLGLGEVDHGMELWRSFHKMGYKDLCYSDIDWRADGLLFDIGVVFMIKFKE